MILFPGRRFVIAGVLMLAVVAGAGCGPPEAARVDAADSPTPSTAPGSPAVEIVAIDCRGQAGQAGSLPATFRARAPSLGGIEFELTDPGRPEGEGSALTLRGATVRVESPIKIRAEAGSLMGADVSTPLGQLTIVGEERTGDWLFVDAELEHVPSLAGFGEILVSPVSPVVIFDDDDGRRSEGTDTSSAATPSGTRTRTPHRMHADAASGASAPRAFEADGLSVYVIGPLEVDASVCGTA